MTMPSDPHILLVDDSPTFLALLFHKLQQGGYRRLTTATSGREALEWLGIGKQGPMFIEPVDLILLDIIMPEMSGIEACRLIKEDERFRDVPVVMITGVNDVSTLNGAFAAGAIDYILKPVRPVE
nr:response regulator [Desulfobacteraceae bacterium]